MSHQHPVFKRETPLMQGILQVKHDPTAAWETIGRVADVSLLTAPTERQSAPNTDTCPPTVDPDSPYFSTATSEYSTRWGEVVTRHDAALRATLTVPRSVWVWQMLYGLKPENATLGALTSVTEVVPIMPLAGGTLASLLTQADGAGLAQNVIVAGAVFGIDYDLVLWGGYTAVVALAGGSLAAGDLLNVTYDITPLSGIDLCGGLPTCAPPRAFRVVESLATSVPTALQSGQLGVTFSAADVVSPISLNWAPCSTEQATFGIEIRNRPRTSWCLNWGANDQS